MLDQSLLKKLMRWKLTFKSLSVYDPESLSVCVCIVSGFGVKLINYAAPDIQLVCHLKNLRQCHWWCVSSLLNHQEQKILCFLLQDAVIVSKWKCPLIFSWLRVSLLYTSANLHLRCRMLKLSYMHTVLQLCSE